MGLPNILHAMRLLREQPGFHFTLDQVAYVRPFLERYPAEEADFRRFITGGRLQLAGASTSCPTTTCRAGRRSSVRCSMARATIARSSVSTSRPAG